MNMSIFYMWKQAIKRTGICLIMCLGLSWLVNAGMPTSYPELHDDEALEKELKSLARAHSDFVELISIATSHEKRDIWLVEVGYGNQEERSERPALLLVAGLEGDHLVGTEVALDCLKRLCQSIEEDAEMRERFEKTTLYIIPRMNPDGAQRFFMKPINEMRGNTTPFDSDHDGYVDEDGPDDLNDDDLISWVRVEDVEGEWILHPDDKRILIKPDSLKGEHGQWFYFKEGKDNDGDEAINEDALGEVNFNRNYPFDYPWFSDDTGIHQVSENETRALADFVVDHPNIGVVLTFASNDNLLKTPPSDGRSSGRDPQVKILNEDVKYYKKLGEWYRETLGIEKEIGTESEEGAFSDWMYFHRGRLSLCAKIWGADIALALQSKDGDKEEKKEDESGNKSDDEKTTGKKEDKSPAKKKEKDDRAKDEIKFLAWLEENAPDLFIPWQPIEHPDYPDQKTEIGGYVPYAKTLPPKAFLEDMQEKHFDFLKCLIDKFPRVEIHNVEVKPLSQNVFDVEVQIVNNGFLPTVLAHGSRTNEVHPTRLELDIDDDSILAGARRIERIGTLDGSGGLSSVRYVIKATPGTELSITLISALAGRDHQTVELR